MIRSDLDRASSARGRGPPSSLLTRLREPTTLLAGVVAAFRPQAADPTVVLAVFTILRNIPGWTWLSPA